MKGPIRETKPRTIRDYGCVSCQKYHEEEDPLYKEHVFYQSKHGIRTWIDHTRLEVMDNEEGRKL